MKILFANQFYYHRGGAEKVLLEEIDLLTKSNHTVVPFTRKNCNNYKADVESYFPSDIKIDEKKFLKQICTGLKLIYSYECKKQFKLMVDFIKPDLVHAHNIYGRLTTSILDVCKKEKIPVVITLHDYKIICPSYLMLSGNEICEKCIGGKYYNCLLSRCHKNSFSASFVYTLETYFNHFLKKYDTIDYFICPSLFIMGKFSEAGIPKNKLVHLPNFIDLNKYNPSYENKNYILFVGRLSKEKGVFTLIKAVRNLDVNLKIVGDGPLKIELTKYVKQNLINNITFEGYKTGIELGEYFKNALFVVVPSEWYENYPMSILESFAYGKPVVGAELGGIPELVINGCTGYTFESGNVKSLKNSIQHMLYDHKSIVQMGKSARNKIEIEHNEKNHLAKLLNIYTRAMLKL